MPDTGSAHAAALWTALHLFLLLGLSVRMARQRQVHRVAVGDGGAPELACAIRAFRAAAEYVPAGIAALALLALLGAPSWLVHSAGATLFLGRVVHAVDLSRTGEATRLQAAGVLATWVAYVFAGVALLAYAVA